MWHFIECTRVTKTRSINTSLILLIKKFRNSILFNIHNNELARTLTNTSTQISTKEAAIELGVSPRQIQKLIKNGKLSAERNESGNYLIDKSEFYRVFPEAFGVRTDANNNEQGSRTIRDHEIKHLEAMLTEKTRQNEFLQKQLESSTLEKTRLLDTINHQQKLIEHQSGKKARKKLFGLF
jgi:excisionase family DNA binding protein